jgi:MarR family transcriptional regulator, organic hydroperoxide resistance regulator
LFHKGTNSLYQLFHQVIRLHFQRVHAILEPLGLHPGQPPVLFALARRGGLKQRELAEQLHIQPATLTVMLKRMEASGYITRRPDPMDLRVSRVFLTEEGKELCLRVKKALAKMEQEDFGALTPGDREKMKEGLTLVRDCLLTAGGNEASEKKLDCE